MKHRFFLLTTLAMSLPAASACEDEVTDPDAFLESAEAEAVMRSAEALPLLPEFLDRASPDEAGDRAMLVRARELWAAGSMPGDPRSEARRRLAVAYALPIVAPSVTVEERAAARERADDWVATAGSMVQHLSMPLLERRLDTARRYLQSSDRGRTEEDRIRYLLLATSTLVETTPRFVARTLAADADAAVVAAERRNADGTDGHVDTRTLERAARLKDWAGRAVEEGDYLLAIQRAYYAIQLAEGP